MYRRWQPAVRIIPKSPFIGRNVSFGLINQFYCQRRIASYRIGLKQGNWLGHLFEICSNFMMGRYVFKLVFMGNSNGNSVYTNISNGIAIFWFDSKSEIITSINCLLSRWLNCAPIACFGSNCKCFSRSEGYPDIMVIPNIKKDIFRYRPHRFAINNNHVHLIGRVRHKIKWQVSASLIHSNDPLGVDYTMASGCGSN
ncbi:MAG: hypothetical protein OMM_03813 [Candidatus Magnetoglobus multicellularis str. Araruama]|uniref:Uncharacterized protein n=1 Tax=Candidatus Magnetoglobus multicellularis str. Araruama TaxID=890399 RepID=A0A1V1P4E8_9BACT|nr:MAG: hypothetical protein OMM_03813 [Candidatus Magnetoglobus multicellularis str. Araruama]